MITSVLLIWIGLKLSAPWWFYVIAGVRFMWYTINYFCDAFYGPNERSVE